MAKNLFEVPFLPSTGQTRRPLLRYNLRNQLHMPIASKIFSLSGQELTILERKKKCREPSFQEWLIIGVINKSIITK
jgi:hypothetical protein